MAITLTSAFLAELKKNINEPVVVLEVALDSGIVKWGTSTGGFPDVSAIVKSVSSLQNKLDTKSGFSTRGELTFTIVGRDNFKTLIKDNYLKNRRVTRKDGFSASLNSVVLLNPSFEVDTSSWDTASSWWINTGAVLTRSASEYKDGIASAQIATGTGATQRGIKQQLNRTFLTGVPYTLTGWVKSNTTTASIRFFFGGTTTGGFVQQDINLSTSWQQVTLVWTPTATITLAYAGVKNMPDTDITFFVDDWKSDGFLYSDYAPTFTGRISDWSRKGDELTITVSDDLIDASRKIPVENSSKTQKITYSNYNPVDIMKDILLTQLGISASLVDTAKFDFERDTWLPGWKFDRCITEPKAANEYLNELQQETNSFLIHDGEKISLKVFSPPVPGQSIPEWTDGYNILDGSLSLKSGYKDGFFNRIVLYYDYDESGSDKEENFENVVISADAASQGAAQWNEVKSKIIKSKWIKSLTWTQTGNITGVAGYHISRANGAGSGNLTYNDANNTLQWTAPGGSIGEAVTLSKDGKYQVFSSDKTKWVRVIATTASLPASNQTDTITITALAASTFAETLAQKLLSRYRDPAAICTFDVDLNNCATGTAFIKPTDLKDITTDEAFEKGEDTWTKERCMLTSVRPDFASGKVSVEAVETKFYRRYGFIAPAGYPDYPSASAAQREYGFIGDANNKVNGGTEDGYYIW